MRLLAKALRRRRRDERGATAILVGVLMSTVLVAITAFTVDLGTQRVARRDMQAVADLVALDMSRQLDGVKTASALTASTEWNQALARSLARNTSAIGGTPTVTAEVGTVDGATGTFTVVTGTTIPSSVRVSARTEVDFAFGLASRGGASRSAVATARSTACFRLGSYAAGLNSADSPLLSSLLNGALGLNVSAVSYQGLAGADLGLLGLATQLGLGSVDELATTTVTAGQLFLAAAQVAQSQGNTAQATVLNNLATTVGPLSPIPIAGIVSIATGQGAGVGSSINALDLVSGAAFLANGSNALSIPSLGTDLGLLGTNLTTSVKIIEGAQMACGASGVSGLTDPRVAVARTSQGDINISGTLASVSAPNLTGLTVSAGKTDISVQLAKATGTMTRIVCGAGTSGSPQGMDVSVASQLTSASVTQTVSVDGNITSGGLLGSLLGGLLGSILSVEIHGTLKLTTTTAQPSSTRSVQIRVPNAPPNWKTGVGSGSGELGLDKTTTTAVWTDGPRLTARGLLGIRIDLSVQQIANLTQSLVTNLTNGVLGSLLPVVNTTLLSPLQRLLGLELAGATVFGVPTPSCQSPILVG